MTTEPKCAVTDNESGKPCGAPAAGVARQATAPFYVCQADVPRAEAAGYVVTPLDLADGGGGR